MLLWAALTKPRPVLDTRQPATKPGTWGSQPPYMRLTDVENFARRLPTRATRLTTPETTAPRGTFNAAHLTDVPPYEKHAVVAEPDAAGVRADVAGRGQACRGRLALGEKQRPAGAARPVGQPQHAGQQVGGAGSPVHPLDLSALGADGRTAVCEIEPLDVERQGL